MAGVVQKSGKRKQYKDYDLAVGAYLRKGYVKVIHKRSGNSRYFKIR